MFFHIEILVFLQWNKRKKLNLNLYCIFFFFLFKERKWNVILLRDGKSIATSLIINCSYYNFCIVKSKWKNVTHKVSWWVIIIIIISSSTCSIFVLQFRFNVNIAQHQHNDVHHNFCWSAMNNRQFIIYKTHLFVLNVCIKNYVILSHSLVCKVKKISIQMYQLKCINWNKMHQIDLIQIFATLTMLTMESLKLIPKK